MKGIPPYAAIVLAAALCALIQQVPGGSNGTGASLKGIDGHAEGSFPGLRYSRAMNAAGLAWDAKSLDAYQAEAQKVVPGSTRPVPSTPEAAQRARCRVLGITCRAGAAADRVLPPSSQDLATIRPSSFASRSRGEPSP